MASVAQDKFFFCLCQLIIGSKVVPAREFCAVMLRQHCARTAKLWTVISANTQGMVKKSLLDLFRSEQNRSVRRKVCDVIGVLAGHLLPANQWPELMPTIMEISGSPQPLYRESCLDVLDRLCEYAVAILIPHVPALKKMFTAGLSDDANPSVQLAALRATCSLLQSMPSDRERSFFTDVIPLMFKGITIAHNKEDDDVIKDHGEVLVNLVRNCATFLRTALKPVIGSMAQIVANRKLMDDTRRVCFEFLLTLMENGKGMVRKGPVRLRPLALHPCAESGN
jgi:hypothetical protein